MKAGKLAFIAVTAAFAVLVAVVLILGLPAP